MVNELLMSGEEMADALLIYGLMSSQWLVDGQMVKLVG